LKIKQLGNLRTKRTRLRDKRTGELEDKRTRLEDKSTGELEDKRTRLEDKSTGELEDKRTRGLYEMMTKEPYSNRSRTRGPGDRGLRELRSKE
jgi:hypothetical protein